MALHPVLSVLLRSKTAALLVVAQVALTLAIVCNALFVVRTRLATAERPSGVDERGAFQLQYVAAGTIDDRAGMHATDVATLRALPGVLAVAGVNSLPLSGSGWSLGVSSDRTRPDSALDGAAYFSGESIIDVLGLELVEGRDFRPDEVKVVDPRAGGLEPDHVILTRHLARRLFPDDASVVGKTVYFGTGDDARPMQVVGVVARLMSPGAQPGEHAYDSFLFPIRYLGGASHYAVRTAPGDRARVMAEAEAALSALRNDRVLVNLRGVDELRERRYKQERYVATVLIAVMVGLLVVTAGGIVGIASLWVNQRRKQIGVRRALGARRADILGYFVGENLLLTTAGVVLGVVLALAINRSLASNVELGRLPLGYLAGGVVGAWLLGVVAVLGPAWRAASVPPAVATRTT